MKRLTDFRKSITNWSLCDKISIVLCFSETQMLMNVLHAKLFFS